ncbi:PQQ-like beta-propeller repeat protein [Mycobacterium manitobense]|uniref:PQQ-like beta-propeller repeat protein n=1 Tax=[Mycobacterium] manitobense TaxID=190147 RepID=A0A9X2YS04_9MYCO|nr:PQQ-binding-like beta-propeller repeat protein [[Mycobacterium] manitobense]MCV7172296.1 PQQ-like beta-propeller repeat protein [[Mycobacterium] manitobense]
MTGVDRGELGWLMRAALETVMTAFAGLAVTLLLWASGLALWSRQQAEQARHVGGWPGYIERLPRLGDSPVDALAVVVWIAAVTLLAAAVVSVWLGRTRRSGAVRPVVVAGVLALAVYGIYSVDIPSFYARVTSTYPVTPALPAGVAAWLLGAAAAVAVLLVAVRIPLLSRRDMRVIAIGAVLGVVLASATTVAAVRAGDDARYVDATPAAGVDVPPVPTALGQKRFTVTIPDAYDDRGDPQFRAAAAGAGFVVRKADTVTAYGADGAERWHYRRTGPGASRVETVRVFDDGATVVAWIDGGDKRGETSVVALDAVTGDELWSGSGRQLYTAKGSDSPPYLVYRDDRTWTRTDSRTGKPMWTVSAPHAECPTEYMDTAERLVSLSTCFENQQDAVWLTVLDPQTGSTVWDHLLREGPPEDASNAYPSGSGSALSGSGVLVRVSDPQAQETNQYVDVVDRTITDLPRELTFREAPGPNGDILGTQLVGRDERLTLFDGRGSERCSTVGGFSSGYPLLTGTGFDTVHLTFGDTFVVYDQERANLVTLDSTTCAEVTRTPAPDVEGLLPVSGANLVFRRGENRTLVIDGYR